MQVILTGGPERIRTAVEAFAELCLATRPQDHFLSKPVSITLHYFFKTGFWAYREAKIKQSKEI